jgi:hypothetical protein
VDSGATRLRIQEHEEARAQQASLLGWASSGRERRKPIARRTFVTHCDLVLQTGDRVAEAER